MMNKLLAIIFSTALSATAFANTIESTFSKDSILPKALQEKILKYVTKNCHTFVSGYGLRELQTIVTGQMPDRGMMDTFFKTVFASRYYSDGMHPATTYITVESVEYDSPAYGKDYDVIEAGNNRINGCE